ncbi:mucin-2-like [Halichondria panicea]|uniref:mucin-2-like n=1 Tax=Halichondria panicea TaxID=6063 RepID=UPI00312B2E58
MTLHIYWLIGVLLICFLAGLSTAQYSVSVERPCPMETVTFTCTAPGDFLRWEPSDATRPIAVRSTSDLNVASVVSGYTVTLIAFNDTTLTSTLSRTAKNGTTVSCVGIVPTLTTIGSSTIRLVDLPRPPSIRHSILSSSSNEVSVSVQWDPPTETGGRDDLTYTVTISPPAQLSATVLTSTSVTVTAQYNVDYTVSVVATNCAGNSTAAEYNFRIGNYCPVLTNPMNGVFGPTTNSLPGSTVTIQCDAGYVSTVTMVTCEGTLMWSPDPEAIECTSLTTPTPTTLPPPMNCTASLPPPRNGTISGHSVPAIPGTRVAFQCDYGLFPEGIMTATCLATGEWDRNMGEIVCRAALCNCASLSDGSRFDAAVSISVVVTTALFTVIGLLMGLLIMYLLMRKKAAYSLSAEGQANVGPTVPAGPVYEEVSPKEEIELNTNQAYGPVGL